MSVRVNVRLFKIMRTPIKVDIRDVRYVDVRDTPNVKPIPQYDFWYVVRNICVPTTSKKTL